MGPRPSDATPPARAPKPSGSIARTRIRMKGGKKRMRMILNFRILTFQEALKSAIPYSTGRGGSILNTQILMSGVNRSALERGDAALLGGSDLVADMFLAPGLSWEQPLLGTPLQSVFSPQLTIYRSYLGRCSEPNNKRVYAILVQP